ASLTFSGRAFTSSAWGRRTMIPSGVTDSSCLSSPTWQRTAQKSGASPLGSAPKPFGCSTASMTTLGSASCTALTAFSEPLGKVLDGSSAAPAGAADSRHQVKATSTPTDSRHNLLMGFSLAKDATEGERPPSPHSGRAVFRLRRGRVERLAQLPTLVAAG